MKIILAEHSGFCMGVRNAVIRIVNELNSSSEEIYIHGPLIHNPQTVEALKKRGLITIDEDESVKNKQIAIRTHGMPYDKSRRIKGEASRTINLTCSRVTRVQSIIKKYSARGFHTLICGDHDHAEVTGLKSYAVNGYTVLSRPEDIKIIPRKENYLLVSQTTYDRSFFQYVEKEISKNHKKVLAFDTICDSTKLRQDDVHKAIENGIDTLVVIGGKNSANTERLVEIGESNNIKTIHVETEGELEKNHFDSSNFVLVTAGASTPGWIINNVLEKIYHFKYKKGNIFQNKIKSFFEILIRTHVVTSVSASLLSIIFQLLMVHTADRINFSLPLIAFFYLFSMFSINNLLEISFLKASNALKFNIYEKFKITLLLTSCIFIILIFYLTYLLHYQLLIFFSCMLFCGIIYSTGMVKKIIVQTKNNFFRKIYQSKIVISGGASLIVAIPLLVIDYDYSILFFLIYTFTFFYLRQNLIDLIALNSDLILGKESIPVVLGKKLNMKISLSILLAGAAFVLALSLYLNSAWIVFLLLPLLYFGLLLTRMLNMKYLIAVKHEFLVDYSAIILGGIAFILYLV